MRDAEPRITLMFTVSEENTAASILKAKLKSKQPISFKIRGMMEQSEAVFGHVLPIQFYQMYDVLSSNCTDLTLPSIRVAEVAEAQEPQLVTNIIFRQDKMVGSMPEDENLYYMILKDKMESGILLTGVPECKKIFHWKYLKAAPKLSLSLVAMM